ncbi:ATP-binding protein [Thermosulfurimonas sp. F29]|nr:ATP-binding protein [Thermosulfurimonas sp. F29]
METLEREDLAERNSFVVVHGRRRVGKTRLILEHIGRRKGSSVYVQVPRGRPAQVLYRFMAEEISRQIGTRVELESAEGLTGLLKTLMETTAGTKLCFVLDEVPRLMEADPSFASVLQAFWDVHADAKPDPRLLLILCGSARSVMRRAFFDTGEPLYGRKTMSIHVRPLDLEDLCDAFGLTWFRGVALYAIVGGIPGYWTWLDPTPLRDTEVPFKEACLAVLEQALRPDSPFLDEPLFILREETSAPDTLLGLVRAIGRRRASMFAAIQKHTGMPPHQLAPYLKNLIELGMVRREKQPFRDKKSFYVLDDPVLCFCFRCVEPFAPQVLLGGFLNESVRNRLWSTYLEHLESFWETWWTGILYTVFPGREAGRQIVKTHTSICELDFAVYTPDGKKLLALFEATFSVFGQRKLRQIKTALDRIAAAGVDTSDVEIVALAPKIDLSSPPERFHWFDFPIRDTMERLLEFADRLSRSFDRETARTHVYHAREAILNRIDAEANANSRRRHSDRKNSLQP